MSQGAAVWREVRGVGLVSGRNGSGDAFLAFQPLVLHESVGIPGALAAVLVDVIRGGFYATFHQFGVAPACDAFVEAVA